MRLRVAKVILLAFGLSLSIASCQKKLTADVDGVKPPPGAPSPVEIRFKGLFNRLDDLTLDSSYHYFNDVADPNSHSFMRITALKYYISNMEFINDVGDTVKIADGYFLIDHSKPEVSKASFMVPAGSYYAMSFMLGVDGARSLNGPRTGALDPALNMFWNANDGYVNAMIEGFKGKTGTNLPATDIFSFRVGGYKDPYNTLSRRSFKLGGTALISVNRKTVINLTADAIQWFRGNSAPFDTMPIIDAPGAEALKLSQNYFKMFTFTSVKYE